MKELTHKELLELIETAAKVAADTAVEKFFEALPVLSEYLTTEEAARYVKYSEQYLEIARHKADGSGPPYIKQQRVVRYRKIDLDEWMVSARVVDQPAPSRKRKGKRSTADMTA